MLLGLTGLLGATVHAQTCKLPHGCDITSGNTAALTLAIREASAIAGPHSINLKAGIPYTVTSPVEVDTALPSIGNAIAINGNGAVIERTSAAGAPQFRLIHISSTGILTLDRVTLRNGLTRSPGGAILNEGVLKLTNCVVSGNRSLLAGGLANYSDKDSTIDKSTFENNQSIDGPGGALANRGNGVLSITNSTFFRNTAEGGEGGAIFNFPSGSRLLIVGSTLSENLSTRFHPWGGALVNGAGSFATLTNSTVSRNRAGDGGGVFNAGTVTMLNTTVAENVSERLGGGLFNYAFQISDTATAVLVNSLLANNLNRFVLPNGTESLTPDDCFNNQEVIAGRNSLIADGTCNATALGFVTADPRLGPLASNGGRSRTHALPPGSPAIDAGSPADCPRIDQRGALRPRDGNGDSLAQCDIGAFELGQERFSDIGESDDFHAGDAADVPPKSLFAQRVLDYIATDPGQGPAANLDAAGADRPVALTHFLSLPAGAQITAATLEVRAKGTNAQVFNDSIVYDESTLDPLNECKSPCTRKQYSPLIALRDLAGHEPAEGENMQSPGSSALVINLAKVPVRTRTQFLPGAHWSSAPDEYRDLLGSLADGEFNLIVGDDTMIDYSRLSITYVLPGGVPGDLNGDSNVDINDVNIIASAIGTKAYGSTDPRDLDHDLKITAADARLVVNRCAKPGCATS